MGMRDLQADILADLADVQGLASTQPIQDLDVEPQWLRVDRRRQRDRQRHEDKRDTQAIVQEMIEAFSPKLCACGCERTVERRRKYASDECRAKARQQRDRARKAEQRAEVLRQIREAEGIAERVCARDGCEVWFPVELSTPGRPQEYCSVKCRVLAAVRSWRERRRKQC